MPRETTRIEATIIDYVFRNGGEGDKQAIVDYMNLVEGYSESHVARTLHTMARDGVIDRWGGNGRERSTYRVLDGTEGESDAPWDPYNGDDGL